MIYEWKNGSRISADAQKVGEELERIPNRTAESIVEAARKSKGELHKSFEWDDTRAAEAHRLDQARLILRSIVTTVKREAGGETETVQIRAYESVLFADDEGEAEKAMTYVPTRKALADPELRAQIMDRLESTIHEAEQTADSYTYLVPAFRITKEKLKEARETVRA